MYIKYTMKKYVVHVSIFLLFIIFCFIYNFSYGKIAQNVMCSQIEYDYFCLETDYYNAKLRFGVRESYFRRDMIRTQKKQYGVLTIKFFGDVPYAQNVVARLKIRDEEIMCILEKNPFDSSFMCDIERVYKADKILLYVDNVDFQYHDLTSVTSSFNADYSKALDFSFKTLKSFIDENKDAVECYLTIRQSDDNQQYLWYFVAVGKTQTKFILFDHNLNICLMS